MGWSCGGSWMDGCCECLVSVPPPTPIWVGGSGSWRALSLTLLWSTLLLWPPCCSWPPGALVLTVPCTQAFKGPPLTLSTPGRPIGSDFPRGTILGNSWRHCHHQGGEAGIPSSSLRQPGLERGSNAPAALVQGPHGRGGLRYRHGGMTLMEVVKVKCGHKLPGGASGIEPACQCRRHRFSPWVRKIPWRRAWQPTPV